MTGFAAVGQGSQAYWYLTRSTGLVSFVLLSGTVFLGIVASVGWTSQRWPRFLSQGLHRNLSLYCVVLVAVHIVTTVSDGFVPITFVDAVVPFVSPYRPIWLGLGALAFDLMLAILVTSALRRRIGLRSWRAIHWLAYLSWPVALLHGLGTGTDTPLAVSLSVYVVCILGVVGAIAWRLVSIPVPSPPWRVAAGVGAVATVPATAMFAVEGPLRAGWSHRAGTSSALLSQLSPPAATAPPATASPSGSGGASASAGNSPSAPKVGGSTPGGGSVGGGDGGGSVGGGDGGEDGGGVSGGGDSSAIPAAPFSTTVSGTLSTSALGHGDVQVDLRMTLAGVGPALVVVLDGVAVDGGVAMHSSEVTFGGDHGTVTALEGTTVVADVSGSGQPLALTMDLNLDEATGTVTGFVSGAAA
jgi:sulfoxide reductase heme-binding subunit YedZ